MQRNHRYLVVPEVFCVHKLSLVDANKLFTFSLVDGAIHKAAGKSLKEECGKLKGTPTGTAKITGGHSLHATCQYLRKVLYTDLEQTFCTLRYHSCCRTSKQRP